MMTNEEMKDALTAANAALVEKLGKQPYLPLTLELSYGGKWICGAAYFESNMRERFGSAYVDTPEAAFASIMDKIAKMPSEGERDLHEFQRKTAELIDFANEKGIDAKFVNPLVTMARDLASNAITAEAGE